MRQLTDGSFSFKCKKRFIRQIILYFHYNFDKSQSIMMELLDILF